MKITKDSAHKDGYPEPIWWAKACRQIGIDCKTAQYTKSNGQPDVMIELPELPDHVFNNIKARAEFLEERDRQGLPTEEKPSGGFPDSDDEIADPIALKVAADDGAVVIDFGRPVRAVNIHPATASYLATLLTQAAIEAGLDTSQAMNDMTVKVATVKDPDGNIREAVLRLPSPFGPEEEDEEGEG